jgi:hypothetical protein
MPLRSSSGISSVGIVGLRPIRSVQLGRNATNQFPGPPFVACDTTQTLDHRTTRGDFDLAHCDDAHRLGLAMDRRLDFGELQQGELTAQADGRRRGR